MTEVILVDKEDNEIGREEKIKAHLEGKLHRAFSIFIFNKKGEMLLQKRAKTKYHSAGLWSNACCSHPRPGYNLEKEAERRLKEEMGVETKLKEIFVFSYKVKLGKMTENEVDHVFVGEYNDQPKPSPDEAEDWKWISPGELRKDVKKNPQNYTYWFKFIFERVLKHVGL